MNLLYKLERKFGKYAIPNLSRYFVFASLIGMIFSFLGSLTGVSIQQWIAFDVGKILHFQIWRLVTWVFCSSGLSFLSLLFLLCLIPMGQTLESIIGTFRMNVYLIGGVIISDIGGLIVYAIGHSYYSAFSQYTGTALPFLSGYYILLSIFMALALEIPDATVNLYFVLPIKMKWMLVVYFLDLGYQLYRYFSIGMGISFRMGLLTGFGMGSQIIFALVNLGVFYWLSRSHVSMKQRRRKRAFRAQTDPGRAGGRLHKCEICGRTSADSPQLLFRYCSRCKGNHEYCEEHLFTHTHIT